LSGGGEDVGESGDAFEHMSRSPGRKKEEQSKEFDPNFIQSQDGAVEKKGKTFPDVPARK